MSWETVKLGDITSSIQTGPFGSQLHQSDYTENGTPVVMPKDLVDGHISEQSIARVPLKFVEQLSRHKIAEGDILYSRRGDVGRCALATGKESGWLCGTGCLRVAVNEELANPKFVFYQLRKAETVGWVVNHAVGSTMLNLNTNILSNVPIEIPELEYQNKVVSVLSAYDDLIENNRQQIKLLEEAAQRLYKEWFVDLRFPGWETTPITDGVPEGWEIQTIDEMACIVKRGISPRYNEKAKFVVINQKCIRQSVMDISEARRQEKTYSVELNLQDSDTVICSTGTGTLGRVGQVYGDYSNTTFDSHVTLVRAKEKSSKQFLYYAIKHNEAYLKTMGKGSTNQQELGKDVIKAVELLVPTNELLFLFESLIQAMHNRIRSLRDQILLAVEARDCLLPKLMSGEIEV